MTREQRRLAAIVCADVAGYSRLMGRNDSGTLAALKTHRRELIDPKVAEHGGRIVKTTGDGLLLEFQSVVDAVRFAVDVQRGMGWRNGGVPADQRIEFRMGVNVGDLIIDGDDLYGDGVNVAARLQALAEPGGIWASKAVRDQVADKVGFAFDELGARQVKNIERPIEAYRIRDEPGAADARPATHRLKLFWRVAAGSRRPLLAVLAIAAIAAGAATWYVLVQTRAPATGAGPPLMSLAVMPFAPASPSDQDERLAERLTQDVTSAAERAMRFALIASHGRVSGYKGSPFEPRAVGRDLNVRYLLEGSIRTGTGQLTLVARLVETESGKQLWSTSLTSAAPAAAAWVTSFPS